MPSYTTPGVYVEEIKALPASVAPVATAVPAFIGLTAKATGPGGADLTDVPTRITSLLEYEALFGGPPVQAVSVDITKKVDATTGALLSVEVAWNTAPAEPASFTYHAVQMYYANGGGPCWIVSVGADTTSPTQTALTGGITALEAEDEPTLLCFPDVCKIANNAQYGATIQAALLSCQTLQDRFTIADVRAAIPGGTVTNANVTTVLRNTVSAAPEALKYGAAYFPYLRTTIAPRIADGDVTLQSFGEVSVAADGTEAAPVDQLGGATPLLNDATLNLKGTETAVYNAVRGLVDAERLTLPPSGAVAGAYARVDRTRGVWKAPANVGLALVAGPAVPVTDALSGELNVDPGSGKSVNAIRAFTGKGTLIWGARTLAGNDGEWKYVPVRRFANFAEESIKKAIGVYVFEPNDANTWNKVRTMIEAFLFNQWRDGALQGAKPEQAFGVDVGLGKTMTPDDILNGLMIVEVRLAIVRPAEFIVLRFIQKLPEA